MTETEFRDAFHRNKDVLFRFAYRMTGSETAAEDVVQDCFAALWRNPRAYDPDRGTLRAFLLGMARHRILKNWRDERPAEELCDDTALCSPIDLAEVERGEAVSTAVARLPQLQREALVLAEYEEMSLDQIAQATGAELAAVKSRLHRARQNLRRMLAPLLESKGVTSGRP
jgi:RNA polymerase sigma-70 factor, ECF subfamily